MIDQHYRTAIQKLHFHLGIVTVHFFFDSCFFGQELIKNMHFIVLKGVSTPQISLQGCREHKAGPFASLLFKEGRCAQGFLF